MDIEFPRVSKLPPYVFDQIQELKMEARRNGEDVTIVSWSQTANFAVQASETLSLEGVEAEVVDLRSLWPWDKQAVLKSVKKMVK